MSFRIYVSGSNGFRYERDNCPDDDVFEAAAVISALNASGPSAGGAVEGAADYLTPSVGVLDGVESIARRTMTDLLRTQVTLLAARRSNSNGWISVSANQDALIGPGPTGFARYEFYNDADPGGEFIRTILPALNSSGFNNYGVFRAIALAVSSFSQHRPSSGPPMMLIQMSK